MHESHLLSDLRNRDHQAARGTRSGGGVGPGVAQFSGWALSLPARPPARGLPTLAGPSSTRFGKERLEPCKAEALASRIARDRDEILTRVDKPTPDTLCEVQESA